MGWVALDDRTYTVLHTGLDWITLGGWVLACVGWVELGWVWLGGGWVGGWWVVETVEVPVIHDGGTHCRLFSNLQLRTSMILM